MQRISQNDLKTLKRILNLAIVDEKARDALSEGRLPAGKWKLSSRGMDVLHSITSEELSAFASVYQKMVTAGAGKASLHDAIIL